MKKTILVRGARQLLTLRGPTGPRRGDAMRDLGLIEDGSLLIVNGIIDSVGPTRRIENLAQARAAEEITATGHVVMPGLVDSHTHLLAPPARLADHAGERTAANTITPRDLHNSALHYVRSTSSSTLEFYASRFLDSALRHGTTTIEAKAGYGLHATSELKMLRVLSALAVRTGCVVPTYLGAHVPPPESEVGGCLSDIVSDHIPRVASRQFAQFADVFCDPLGFRADQARQYLQAARRAGLGLRLHGKQTGECGAVRLAVEMEATTIAGLNAVDLSDADLLSRSRTVAALLPPSGYPPHLPPPPARMLLDQGVAVALASGFNPAAKSTFNMQSIASLACSEYAMTPEEVVSATTINGAHALSRGARCGSLEFGKDADLIMLNVSDYRDIASYFGGNAISLVMKRGEIVYREGPVTWGGES